MNRRAFLRSASGLLLASTALVVPQRRFWRLDGTMVGGDAWYWDAVADGAFVPFPQQVELLVGIDPVSEPTRVWWGSPQKMPLDAFEIERIGQELWDSVDASAARTVLVTEDQLDRLIATNSPLLNLH